MARARIKLQFNLCENSWSEDLIAIQSMCNTIDLGLCLKPLTREFCVSGVQSSRDWKTKVKRLQSTVKDKMLQLLDTGALSQTIDPNAILCAFVNLKDNSSRQCSNIL